MNTHTDSRENQKFIKAILVLCSQAPTFAVLAIKSPADRLQISCCPIFKPDLFDVPLAPVWFLVILSLLIVPHGIVYLKWRYMISQSLTRDIQIPERQGAVQPSSDYFIAYLFAVVSPFWSMNSTEWTDIAVILFGVAFIFVIYWHLDIHYLNWFFLLKGYRIFRVTPALTGSGGDCRPFFVITKKFDISQVKNLRCHELSSMVLVDLG